MSWMLFTRMIKLYPFRSHYIDKAHFLPLIIPLVIVTAAQFSEYLNSASARALVPFIKGSITKL